MKYNLKIVVITVLLATILAFASHVIIQGWEDKISAENVHHFEAANEKDKLGAEILIVAGTTALLPVIASYFMLYLIWSSLPGNRWWKKGLLYGVVLLVIKSGLVREPVMGLIMDVPAWLVFAKQLDVWVPNIILGLVLAWGVKLHKEKRITNNRA